MGAGGRPGGRRELAPAQPMTSGCPRPRHRLGRDRAGAGAGAGEGSGRRLSLMHVKEWAPPWSPESRMVPPPPRPQEQLGLSGKSGQPLLGLQQRSPGPESPSPAPPAGDAAAPRAATYQNRRESPRTRGRSLRLRPGEAGPRSAQSSPGSGCARPDTRPWEDGRGRAPRAWTVLFSFLYTYFY